jgi:hypothetical protein
MDNADYRRILEEEGFEIIGSVAYQWPMSVCWNLRLRIELATVATFTRLKQRGQPLVVVPTRAEGAHKPFENADKDGR